MSDPVTDFIIRLTSISSALTAVYRQHMADQGDLLPHVLMGEVTRLVTVNIGSELPNWLPEFLQQLEDGLVSRDSDIANLIAVSFVENLLGEDATIDALLPLMGEALRKEVKTICGV